MGAGGVASSSTRSETVLSTERRAEYRGRMSTVGEPSGRTTQREEESIECTSRSTSWNRPEESSGPRLHVVACDG